MNIYVSTTAFGNYSLREIIKVAEVNNFQIEFSSNLPHYPNAYSLVKEAKIEKITHNYFPAPKKPFVLNLASLDKEIRNQSIVHCIKALEFSREISAPFFAAHAGYCLDPNPHELGGKLDKTIQRDRKKYWEVFLKSVSEIEKKAKELGVLFLIENNVLTLENYGNNDEVNPLLCCDPTDIINLFSEITSNSVGLLLDTGHLKVSSRTLNFELKEAVNSLNLIIKAIHHSDNDGQTDTNDPIKNNYWFEDMLPVYKDLPHVLEVKNQSLSEINEQKVLLSEFAKK
ncbi:MAG: TIM barrel protein [Balneolales bacterium]